MHAAQKKMFEPTHQHPVAALTKAFQILKDNIITIIVLLVVGGSNAQYTVAGLLIFTVLLLIWGVVSWYRFTYQVQDGELHIKQGVFVRKDLYMSGERIQVVDITAGVIQRLFGLVALDVKTAGSKAEEAKISALTRTQAEKIKSLLMEAKKQEGEQEAEDEEVQEDVHKLSTRDLIIAASTSGSFGVALSIIGTILSQVEQVIPEEQMARYFEQAIPSSVTAVMVVSIIVLVIGISWLISFIGTIIKYFDFTLRVQKDQLIVRYGLFEQKQLTVPFNRIQAVQIKEGIFRQPFGYATLIIESAGYGDEQGNSTTLYPLLRKDKVSDFLEEVVPEYNIEIKGTPSPEQSLSRYIFRTLRWGLAVILPVWYFVPYGEFGWLLLIPACWLGYLQYNEALIGQSGTTRETLIMRFRLLSKTTALIKKNRIQSAEMSQNPFQKRRSLQGFSVTIASGSQGRTFTIRDVTTETANNYLQWVSPVPTADNQSEEGSSEAD